MDKVQNNLNSKFITKPEALKIMFLSIANLLKKPSFYFITILGLAYFAIGFYNLSNIDLAGDETAHLASGYSYTTGYGVNVEHPTLLKNLNAAVIAVFFPEFKSDSSDQWNLGVDFLINSPQPSSQILMYSRLVYLIFNSLFILALAFYTFKLKFLNPKFSWILGIFYVFSPSFFSHNFLLTFDVAGSWTSFMVMISSIYFVAWFKETKLKNISKLALFPATFLALALNVKFSNFLWVFILTALSLATFYFNSKNTLVKLKLWRSIKNLLISNLSFIWINNFIAYRERFNGFVFFNSLQIFQPFYFYLKGFIMTIGRSDHIQPNFIDTKLTVIPYYEFINRVFWFKENPMLILAILFCCFYLVYFSYKKINFSNKNNTAYFIHYKTFINVILNLFQDLGSVNNKRFRNKFGMTNKAYLKLEHLSLLRKFAKKYCLVALVIAFPLAYLLSAFNSKLTIGYRHFYPILIFIYALIAYIFSKINFKFNNFAILPFIIGYIIFGILAIPSGLTYTNLFWARPKWQLIRDSTIYWGESETKGFRYLKQNNLFESSDQNLLSGKGWNTALANGGGPNTNIALQEIIGKGNILDNFWQPFVDFNNLKFTDLKQQYLVVDINTIQELSNNSSNNQISLYNLEYLKNNQPIYQENGVFFIFKLY